MLLKELIGTVSAVRKYIDGEDIIKEYKIELSNDLVVTKTDTYIVDIINDDLVIGQKVKITLKLFNDNGGSNNIKYKIEYLERGV